MARRRQFLRSSLLAGAGVLARPLQAAAQAIEAVPPSYAPQVIDLVARSTVIDMLGLLTMDWGRLRSWAKDPAAFLESDLSLLRDSGIHVFHPAVDPNAVDAHAGALVWMERWRQMLELQARHMMPVLRVEDLDRARTEGRIGVVMGLQSSGHFRSVDDVASFHALGQRVSQLTYNERSRLGSGCKDPVDAGLSPFGADVVAAMNRVGMAVDVSHASERTTHGAIDASSQPVLLTHANCRALTPHPRNASDAVLRALARRGGVIGITAVRSFVSRGPRATMEHLLDHFVHAASVAGVAHVGLGSDCDVDPRDPVTHRVAPAYRLEGLHHPRRVFDIAAGLLRRGFSEGDVELVLGGNFRRALCQIWQ